MFDGAVDPALLPAAFGEQGPIPLPVTGEARREAGTYPLAYSVTDFAA
jgi:hypothetical protein